MRQLGWLTGMQIPTGRVNSDTGTDPTGQLTERQHQAPAGRHRGRRTWLWVIGAILGLCGLALAGFVVLIVSYQNSPEGKAQSMIWDAAVNEDPCREIQNEYKAYFKDDARNYRLRSGRAVKSQSRGELYDQIERLNEAYADLGLDPTSREAHLRYGEALVSAAEICALRPDIGIADLPAILNLPSAPTPAPQQGDIDCSQVAGPVWVGPNDPNNLDRDNDGYGCDP